MQNQILTMDLESDFTPDFVEEFNEAQESVMRRLVLGPRQLAQIAAGGLLFVMFCSAVSYKIGRLEAAQSKSVAQPTPLAAAAAQPVVVDRIVPEVPAPAPTPAPTPAPAAATQSVPTGLAGPGTYLQVGVVAKSAFDVRAAAIREMGLKPVATTGPDENSLRLLVGPLPTAAEREQAMNTLDRHNMQWFVKTIAN